MFRKLQKFFDIKRVIGFNIVVFLVIEACGPFFYTTGLVHAVAFFYILLAFIAIMQRPIGDHFLRRFLEDTTAVALFLFAAANVIEFLRLGFDIGVMSRDTAMINLVDLHITGILLILIGAEYVLKTYRRGNFWLWSMIWILTFFALITVFLASIFMARGVPISLAIGSPIPYAYLAGATGILLVGFASLLTIRKIIPVLKTFAEYFLAAFVFITVAGIVVIFHAFLESNLHLPPYQVTYIAMFFLYLSMSFLYLTSRRLGTVSKLYKEVEEYADEWRKWHKRHTARAST